MTGSRRRTGRARRTWLWLEFTTLYILAPATLIVALPCIDHWIAGRLVFTLRLGLYGFLYLDRLCCTDRLGFPSGIQCGS